MVHMLVGWINSKFGLKCFVDSNVWAFCDDLAELLNSEYSNKRRSLDNDGYLYDYTSCQDVSKHVNTMLTLSLYKMIDCTETLFSLIHQILLRLMQTMTKKVQNPLGFIVN